ncbi:MAG: hypothetical protein HYR96_10530 [Deltaproteobacteria bacterium]|nr:hypothetical protein [Deltaproteobacteria bacterium]MBI3293563.1 hypothetical protein [Deltaproteobacteria bacterium]
MLTSEALWRKVPEGYLTTGIGSLPHPYIDAAIQFSFAHSIPFLPQLPARNPQEFMVNQALELLPGLTPGAAGLVDLDVPMWEANRHSLEKTLAKAFDVSETSWSAFERFEPSPSVWSCWTPFLWELSERRSPIAKIQIAGPMTCQWAIRMKDGSSADHNPVLGMQVYRLVLARAIAMCRRLRAVGAVPIIFLDEPGFYGFSSSNHRQRLALEELKLFIQTLKKEEALVGIHCCSNTEWSALLELPIDVLSIDVSLSLSFLLNEPTLLESFVLKGGRLALGVIPTGSHPLKIRAFEPRLLWQQMLETFEKTFPDRSTLVHRILTEALYTSACGLALHSVQDAEAILSHLIEVGEFERSFR